MIKWSEVGPGLCALSDDGYNVCVGSTVACPILFRSYAAHPRTRDAALNSDAAGAYQFLGLYWPFYRDLLKLPDFGHTSQDLWAVQDIKECHALDDVEAGRFDIAAVKCGHRWQSMPESPEGGRHNDLAALRQVYINAGGTVWTATPD